MIHFERSADYDLIRRVMTHPKVWPRISDDSSPAPEDFYPIESDMVWYVIVRDVHPDVIPPDLLGLWMFVPHNGVCWEVHTCLLPEAWGERAHEIFFHMLRAIQQLDAEVQSLKAKTGEPRP